MQHNWQSTMGHLSSRSLVWTCVIKKENEEWVILVPYWQITERLTIIIHAEGLLAVLVGVCAVL